MTITIYHNPDCGTSRNALAAIRAAGHEPKIVEYLSNTPTHAELKSLIARMQVPARAIMRKTETLYQELGLDQEKLSDDELIAGMIANPILINRPIVAGDTIVRMCRPSEVVKQVLAQEVSVR